MQRLIGVHHLRGLLDAVVTAHDHARIALVAGLQQVGDHTIEFAQLLSHMRAVGAFALQHVVHVRQIAQCQRGIVPLHHALRGLRDPLGAADVGPGPPEVEEREVAKLGLQAIAQGTRRAEDVRVLAPVGGVLGSRRHRDVRAAEHVEPAEQVRHRHTREPLACGFPHHGALQQTVGLSPQAHFALVAVHPAVCNGAVVSRRLAGEQVALACAGDGRCAWSQCAHTTKVARQFAQMRRVGVQVTRRQCGGDKHHGALRAGWMRGCHAFRNPERVAAAAAWRCTRWRRWRPTRRDPA